MSMYNHRGLGPAPGTARLNELLDGIRNEFETQARASGEYEHNSKWHVKLAKRPLALGVLSLFNIGRRRTSAHIAWPKC
jgi:hypothetical protein